MSCGDLLVVLTAKSMNPQTNSFDDSCSFRQSRCVPFLFPSGTCAYPGMNSDVKCASFFSAG